MHRTSLHQNNGQSIIGNMLFRPANMHLAFKYSLISILGGCLALGMSAFAADINESAATPDSTAVDGTTVDITGYDPTKAMLLERGEKHREVLELLEARRYVEALQPAKEVVALTRNIYGNNSAELTVPLLNLANIQLRTNNYESARANYSALIKLIELNDNILSPALVEPLCELGRIYNLSGQYSLAERSLSRALRINHAHQGFYNFDQIDLRNSLTESWLELGELKKANLQQRRIVAIHEYQFGKKNPQTVPALFRLANWYGKTNQPTAELNTFRKAYKILEAAEGENNPELITALRFIARSYISQPAARGEALASGGDNSLNPSGELSAEATSTIKIRNGALNALKRAIEINEAQEQPDTLLQAELLLELGDTYTLFGSSGSANKQYKEAWANLALQDDGEKRIRDAFAKPKEIGYLDIPDVYPDTAASRRKLSANPDAFGDGYVVVQFDVSSKGAVKKVTITESYPTGFMERKVKRGMNYARYRPRYENSEARKTTGISYRYEFKYERAGNNDSSEESEPLPNPMKPQSQNQKGQNQENRAQSEPAL